MKILSIFHGKDGNIHVKAGADSAILRQGEPVFVPEPVQVWRSSAVPAIRMSRLGTSIKEANAAEYYDAITLFHLLTPVDPVIVDGFPPYILDRAFSPGQWLAIPTDKQKTLGIRAVRQSLNGCAEPVETTGAFTTASLGADSVIASLSRYLTFRTGDILVFPDKGIELGAPVLDTQLTATIDSDTVLTIRLK